MRLTNKDKIKELLTLEKHKITMTNNDYKELKLGLLEDVEDELNIDLTILAKAFLYGIYFKFEFGKTHICKGHPYNFNSKKFTVVDEEEEGFSPQYIMSYTDCEYKDYAKTWSLRKEDLE